MSLVLASPTVLEPHLEYWVVFAAGIQRDFKNEGVVSLRLFDGGSFCHFGTILPTFVDFRHFLGPIFPFFAFFRLSDTVYSHRGWHPDVLLIANRF